MNIKVNLQDGTPAQFKTEIIEGNLVVTVVSEEKTEGNLFPKWEELGQFRGFWVDEDSDIKHYDGKYLGGESNQNIFSTEDLAKAALATARVSQTYRRYRELIGEVEDWGYGKTFGFLRLLFKKESDFFTFYESNKEDLNLIRQVEYTVQL